jgi:hypothetical protein
MDDTLLSSDKNMKDSTNLSPKYYEEVKNMREIKLTPENEKKGPGFIKQKNHNVRSEFTSHWDISTPGFLSYNELNNLIKMEESLPPLKRMLILLTLSIGIRLSELEKQTIIWVYKIFRYIGKELGLKRNLTPGTIRNTYSYPIKKDNSLNSIQSIMCTPKGYSMEKYIKKTNHNQV